MRDEQANIGKAIESAIEESLDKEAAPIDLQLLADKLYRLLREELRLEKARGANALRRPNG